MSKLALQYVKHEPISLKDAGFSEIWLHEQICNDTSILALGKLSVKDRERVQPGGGRIDMLLLDSDDENETWYEVEVQLGPTDPSHIIRTIEYWDNERRRYPAYEHIAVLVAEQVTARFLNVIGLFAGSIPIIAIQLNALKIGNQIVLNFVKILDQRQLRVDESDAGEDGGDVDRSTWEGRVGPKIMKICDRVADIANEKAETKLELQYKKGRVVLSVPGSFFKMLGFSPKKSFVRIRFTVSNGETWVPRLTQAGIDAELNDTRVVVRLESGDLENHENLLRELIHQAIKEKSES